MQRNGCMTQTDSLHTCDYFVFNFIYLFFVNGLINASVTPERSFFGHRLLDLRIHPLNEEILIWGGKVSANLLRDDESAAGLEQLHDFSFVDLCYC